MLQGASLTLLSLILWGGWGWALRPCHRHKLGLEVGLKVDICICLQARLAFYVCLLFTCFCFALLFQHFVFVLSCAFPLDLILLIFNTPEMQWKLFYAGAIIFKQEGFSEYLIYHPARSGCLGDIFYSGFVAILLITELAKSWNSQINGAWLKLF